MSLRQLGEIVRREIILLPSSARKKVLFARFTQELCENRCLCTGVVERIVRLRPIGLKFHWQLTRCRFRPSLATQAHVE